MQFHSEGVEFSISLNSKSFLYMAILNVSNITKAFGRAEHQKTVDLLKEEYPDYDITWSNEGY